MLEGKLWNEPDISERDEILREIAQYPTLFKTPTLSTVSEDCLV
jgi:hypothetical protein